ncbi:MAG: twin arginine-targeting protein translocase TatB [Candidatus Nitrotoga sp. LAW]|nr:MAG: twin arginine-targeting protein translocase TatB [Candidatus Nitrotoga sp. LAW]
MFDVNFSEMMVIAVVAFIVIGPERLPKVARTLGHLLGRGQRYISGVKADIARDLRIEELRQLQEKVQNEYKSAEEAVNQVTQTLNLHAQEVTQSLNQQVEQARESINQQSQLNAEVQSTVQQSTSEQKNFPTASERDKGAPPLSAQGGDNIEGSVHVSGANLADEVEFKTLSSAYQEATRNLYAQQEAARNLRVQEEKLRQLRQNADQQVSVNDQTALQDQLIQQPHNVVTQPKQASIQQVQPELRMTAEQKKFPID